MCVCMYVCAYVILYSLYIEYKVQRYNQWMGEAMFKGLIEVALFLKTRCHHGDTGTTE